MTDLAETFAATYYGYQAFSLMKLTHPIWGELHDQVTSPEHTDQEVEKAIDWLMDGR